MPKTEGRVRKREAGGERRWAIVCWLVAVATCPIAKAGPSLVDPRTVALVELFSGHMAILPALPGENLAASPVRRFLTQTGLSLHLVPLTSDQLVTPEFFNAARFPLALYLNYESYYADVRRAGDGNEALQRYLRGGGTLVVLPAGPSPFYYNQQGRPVGGAGVVGMAIGAGGFERPPPGLTLTFQVNTTPMGPDRLGSSIPFPTAPGTDPRWRPIRSGGGEGVRYTPLLTLVDQNGRNHGEGAAQMEFDSGPLQGGRVLYVWFTLLADDTVCRVMLEHSLRWALESRQPPPARLAGWRTLHPPRIDGQLDDSAWRDAPASARFKRAGAPLQRADVETRLQARWDSRCLYLAVRCAIPDGAPSPDPNDHVRLCLDRAPEGKVPPAFTAMANGQFVLDHLAPGASPRSGRILRATALQRDAWTVEMALPWDTFPSGNALPRLDAELPLQCERQLPGREGFPRKRSVWSPAVSPEPMDNFGVLTLEADPCADDFEGRAELVSGSAHWQVAGGQWKLEQGVLVGADCIADRFEVAGAARGDATWADYRLAVRFQVAARGSDWRDGPWFGIRCRPDGDGYYLTFTDRDCQLHKVIYGVSTDSSNPLAQAAWAPDDQWHALQVDVQANWLEVVLDGRPLFRVKDDAHLYLPSLRRGAVVLAARRSSRSQGDTVVRFDDFEVERKHP